MGKVKDALIEHEELMEKFEEVRDSVETACQQLNELDEAVKKAWKEKMV